MKVKASLIVLAVSVIFPVTLVITYTISVYNKHIMPLWPYISHTGDDPIESCFFSLGLNIVSALYSLIVYLRYVQVRYLLGVGTKKIFTYLNKSSLVWGMIAALTLSMTCSFQQRNVSAVHLVVAVTCSFTALGYFWHQTLFSHVMSRWMTKRVRVFRTVLTITSTVVHLSGTLLFLCTLIVYPMPDHKIREWHQDVGTMVIYLTGSFMEWFVFVVNEMYIASLYWEFKNISLEARQIVIVKEDVTGS